MLQPDRTYPGRPIPARPLNWAARVLGGLGRLRGGGSLPGGDGPGAPVVRGRPDDGPFPAVLAGSASPYDLAEVVPTSGGGGATKPGGRSCTACAYEANGLAGLGGKHVPEVWPGAFSAGVPDYRFAYNRYPDPCTATLAVAVFGCVHCNSGAQAGAVVTVKDALGNVVLDSAGNSTCTISDAGGCTWPVTPGATYTVHVDPAPDYVAPADQTITAVCNHNLVTFTCPADLTDPNYSCVVPTYACCMACSTPLPRSLILDDTLGTVPLAFTGYQAASDGSFFMAVWEGDADRTPTCTIYEPGTVYGAPACVASAATTVGVHYRFWCRSDGRTGARTYGVDATYQVCFAAGTCYLSVSGLPATVSGSVSTCVTPPPSFTCDPPYFPVTVDWNPACLVDGTVIVGLDKAGCIWDRPSLWTVHA